MSSTSTSSLSTFFFASHWVQLHPMSREAFNFGQFIRQKGAARPVSLCRDIMWVSPTSVASHDFHILVGNIYVGWTCQFFWDWPAMNLWVPLQFSLHFSARPSNGYLLLQQCPASLFLHQPMGPATGCSRNHVPWHQHQHRHRHHRHHR